MKCLQLFLLVIASSQSIGSYLSAYSGLHIGQHQYLKDTASLNTPYVGLRLDGTQHRHKDSGWLARGLAADFKQGQGLQRFQGQLPLFHWTKTHGLWVEYQYSQQSLEATLSESAIFLGKDGTTTSIAADANVSSDLQQSTLSLYWYEASKQIGPINYLGVFQTTQLTPAASTLTGTNASLFDGRFSGFGLILGRKKDTRGLSFQWHMGLSQLDSDFSNEVTGHRSASQSESTVYQLDLNFGWQYRYYLAPYWYLVPKVKLRVTTTMQTTMDPQQVDHDTFLYLDSQTEVSLQKRF